MARTILNISAVAVITTFTVIGLLTHRRGNVSRPNNATSTPRETGTPAAGETATSDPALPQRIIAMAPSSGEMVCALGACDRLVGVSPFATYPPELLSKKKIGGRNDADFEGILALDPDLLIIQGGDQSLLSLCVDKGIDFLRIAGDDLASVDKDIREIGQRIGKIAEAEEVVTGIKAQFDEVARACKGLDRPGVLVTMRDVRRPLRQIYTFGKGQFITQLVEIAGGRNIVGDREPLYFDVGAEEVIAGKPDVIIELMPGVEDAKALTERARGQWAEIGDLPAVRDNRIYVLTEDHLLLPGPRVGQLARLLVRTIHPEVQFD